MKTPFLRALALLASCAIGACKESTDPEPNPCEVTPGSCTAQLTADITASRTLYADTVYTLSSFVHVTGNGTVLTIEPGTVIEGTPGSALFILQGAQINANGTATDPIIFTSSESSTNRRPGDWGGLILVGQGQINRSGTIRLEGTETSTANYVVNYSGGSAAGNTGSS